MGAPAGPVEQQQDQHGRSCCCRASCHRRARRSYLAPFFAAFLAGAGAFAASESCEPAVKLTRLPAGRWTGAPPRIDLIVRAETADNFHDPKPMRRTWCPLATSARTVSVRASMTALASFNPTCALAAIRWTSSSVPTIFESVVGIAVSLLSV